MKKPDTIKVRVTRIQPFGIFVMMPDGKEGYIRRKELSLSGDTPPHELVKLEDELEAVLLTPATPERLAELSVRSALPDPWMSFATQKNVGDVVQATIKYLYPDKVKAEVAPGVDGEISAADLCHSECQNPEQIVWIDDRVEAIITKIDRAKQHLQLSVRARLEQIKRLDTLIESLYTEPDVTHALLSAPVERPQLVVAADCELSNLRVALAEDQPELLKAFGQWLREKGCIVEGFPRAADALRHTLTTETDLVIADLDMPEMDGLTLISELRCQKYHGPIAVMSVPDLIEQNLESLYTLGVSAAFVKPLDLNEICAFLWQVKNGQLPDLSRLVKELKATRRKGLPSGVNSWGSQPRSLWQHGSVKEQVRVLLQQLIRDTSAEEGVVFHIDRSTRVVQVEASAGSLPITSQENVSLLYSPVKDVIFEGTQVREPSAKMDGQKRFKNLLKWIDFESCIGVPIPTTETCEHALFLFHRRPNMFQPVHLRNAWAASAEIRLLLERVDLERKRRITRQTILSGEIAAAFNHEINNKATTLELEAKNMESALANIAGELPTQEEFNAIRERCQNVSKAIADLMRITAEFPRISTGKDEAVFLNEVIAFTADELSAQARKTGVKVRLHLSDEVPEISGSASMFRHIFYNIMLNSIQQMELAKSPRRLIEIVSYYHPQDKAFPIKVRFSDSGPGIHRKLWEDIYKLGITTRPGGSGLGLYIADSLVRAMNGKLRIAESLIGIGTQFLLELSN